MSRTEGEAPAPLGCVWVSLALIVFGLPAFIPLVRDAIEEIRIHSSWRETQCSIVRAELETRESSTTRQGRSVRDFNHHLRIQSRHRLDGREITAYGFASRNFEDDLTGDAARAFVQMFPAGKTVPCWYDPSNPERVVLHNEWGDRRRYFLLIPTGGAILFGAVTALVVIVDRRRFLRRSTPERRRPGG